MYLSNDKFSLFLLPTEQDNMGNVSMIYDLEGTEGQQAEN